MKLLTELNEQVEVIVESSEDGKKNLFLSGVFLQAAVANRNKRIYPESVLDREVGRYLKESVARNCGWGELNHPAGPSVNLDRVCLRTVELKKEGTNFIGKAIVTSTPMGNIVRGLLESGGQLGVSSRALGSLKPLKDDLNEVQDDLRLLAIDCVGDPSAPDAWVNGIMENVEYFYDERTGHLAEVAKSEIKKLSTKQITENQLRMFNKFLSEIVNNK